MAASRRDGIVEVKNRLAAAVIPGPNAKQLLLRMAVFGGAVQVVPDSLTREKGSAFAGRRCRRNGVGQRHRVRCSWTEVLDCG